MSVLVLRHEIFEHLGHFTAALDRRKITTFYHDPGDPMSLDGHQAIVVLGGPMSANDPLPWLREELQLIEKALKLGAPLLGICLGAQLIAKALGARVYPNGQLEIGWAPVYFSEAGKKDLVFSGLESPSTFFHWHGETFDLPAGAEWLAWSDKCRHQAFRYGSKVYGLQFHPEVTAEMAADWCRQEVNCGDVATLEDPVDPFEQDQAAVAATVMDRWLSLL
jgi:GMP synthase (glutamine-hydrolysing)